MRAMIMAAGLGTRLMPLTTTLPKPMVPIVGRPALGHILDLLRRHGITEVVVNLHHFPDSIRDCFGDGSRYGMSIRYAFEEELLGTAGGVKNNQSFLEGGTFLVLSGDSLTDVDLAGLVRAHDAHGGVATLVTKRVEDTSQYGVVITDDDDRILGFQEKPAPDEALSDLCNCGIYVFEPAVFDHIPASTFYDFGKQVFPGLLADGVPFHSHPTSDYWNDVGTLDSYREGNSDALSGRARVSMMGSRPLSELGGSGVEGVFVEPGARISAKARLTGPVFVASGCSIGDDAVVRGPAVVGEGTVLAPGAVVDASIVWEKCSIGEGSRVEGSVLAGGVHCGARSLVRSAVVGSSCHIGPEREVDGVALEPETLLA